jgi:hypothetical protein
MAIDRAKAIEQLSQIKVKGNSDGLIPSFGVLIQFLPTNFWNTFSEKMLKFAGSNPDKADAVEEGMERAAAECGYHTGWGIINSEEFKAIIDPMVSEKPADILHGAFAVLSAWGWADAEIVDLSPDAKTIIRSYGYYEAEIRDTYKTTRPLAFMLKGICRAFMDLAYGAPYPNGYGTFKCEQVKAIELGDEWGEFVVSKH